MRFSLTIQQSTDTYNPILGPYYDRVVYCEGQQCLLDALEALGATITVESPQVPVDLFDDESITLTRQVKDFQDVQSAKTDFTQQFNIPSTETNDPIFANYFEENIAFGDWNPYLKLNATIYVHGLPVFYGCVELTGVTYKNGLPHQYNVVFYGQAKNVFTEFGEDTLMDVDWSAFNHDITYANITDSWDQNLLGGNILWPVVDWGSNFVYSKTYKGPNTIASSTYGGVAMSQLRPMIKFKTMIETCFSNYGYTLSGSLLSSDAFTDLYCAPMSYAGPYQDTIPYANCDITMPPTAFGTPSTYTMQYTKLPLSVEVSDPDNVFDNATYEYTAPKTGWYRYDFNANITILTPNATFGNRFQFALMVNNNATSFTGTQSTVGNFYQSYYVPLTAGDKVSVGYYSPFGGTLDAQFECVEAPFGADTMQLEWIMPPTKVADFIGGVLKAYNAVLVPVSETEYAMHNIDDWYSAGDTNDWTKWIDVTDITHEKMRIPAKVSLTHAEGLDLANQKIISLYGRRFGAVEYAPRVDFVDEPLEVETIFNIPVPSLMRETNDVGSTIGITDIQMVAMLDKDAQSVQHPLMLAYYTGNKAVTYPWYFETIQQTTFPTLSTYSAYPTTTSSYSLTYGLETTISGDMATNTMYMVFWQRYLSRLYSSRSRVVYMTAIIPVGEWLNLSLNDTIAVSGNYYKINKITYDMLNERADLELITYPDVDVLSITADGNQPDWTPAQQNPVDGITFAGDGIVGRDVTHGIPNGADYYTDVLGQTTYNDQTLARLKAAVDQLLNRSRKTVMTASNTTEEALSITGETPVVVNLTDSETMGDAERLVFDATNNWIFDQYGGQFRLTAQVSFDTSGNRHLAFVIAVNGVYTNAEAHEYHSSGSLNMTTIANLNAEDKVQILAYDEEGGSEIITMHTAYLTLELL